MEAHFLHTQKCPMRASCAYRNTAECPDNITGCMLASQEKKD